MKKGSRTVEPVDLNEVIRQVLDLVGSQMRRHDISVRLQLYPDLPSVPGDSVQLQQVALNLIVNAIDATAANKNGLREIILATDQLPPADVSLAVRDSGLGIDAAQLERMFTPFYTTKPDGMGMGLSISRTIVEAHGGRLWASQNEGPGATVQFSIPGRVVA